MSQRLRKEIPQVFTNWMAGKLTCQAVQNWARGTSSKDADEFVELVLQHLRGLGEYLITCDDIPVYLEAFEKDPPAAGVAHLEDAGVKMDVKARATDLKDDPFYGPHTKAILRELS